MHAILRARDHRDVRSTAIVLAVLIACAAYKRSRTGMDLNGDGSRRRPPRGGLHIVGGASRHDRWALRSHRPVTQRRSPFLSQPQRSWSVASTRTTTTTFRRFDGLGTRNAELDLDLRGRRGSCSSVDLQRGANTNGDRCERSHPHPRPECHRARPLRLHGFHEGTGHSAVTSSPTRYRDGSGRYARPMVGGQPAPTSRSRATGRASLALRLPRQAGRPLLLSRGRHRGRNCSKCGLDDARPHERAVAWAARICCVNEARLEDAGSGLAPVTEGWFVVNVRDAEWFSSETRGAACWFANEYGEPPIEFAQLGINLRTSSPARAASTTPRRTRRRSSFWSVSAGCSSRARSDSSEPGTSSIHLPGRSMPSWELATRRVWCDG